MTADKEREPNRSWKVAAPLVAILTVAGLVFGEPAFFAAAVIPPLILLITQLSSPTKPERVVVDRVIEDKAPDPGQHVQVTLRIRNTGNSSLTDLRVIDPVPEALTVVEGSPRAAITLNSGSEKLLTYSVVARRGSHVFESVWASVRGSSESIRAELETEGDDQIECKTELEDILLRDKAGEHIGDIVTSKGGSGIEFHSLRDYKNGDPVSRVEWSHLAKTGELATKNFREERSGTVLLVVDARPVADRRPANGHPTGTALSMYAAKRVYSALLNSRHRPGIVVLGVDPGSIDAPTDSPALPYISPGRGADHRRNVSRLLKDCQKAAKHNVDDLETTLYRIVPSNAQVLFFTPLLDDQIPATLQLLDSHDHPSIIGSPNITYGDSCGSRLERIERELRIDSVKGFAPVIDWNVSQPLSIQVTNFLRRIYSRDID